MVDRQIAIDTVQQPFLFQKRKCEALVSTWRNRFGKEKNIWVDC